MDKGTGAGTRTDKGKGNGKGTDKGKTKGKQAQTRSPGHGFERHNLLHLLLRLLSTDADRAFQFLAGSPTDCYWLHFCSGSSTGLPVTHRTSHARQPGTRLGLFERCINMIVTTVHMKR